MILLHWWAGVARRGHALYKRKLSENENALLLWLPKELKESYHSEKERSAIITPIGTKKAMMGQKHKRHFYQLAFGRHINEINII